MKNNKAQWLIAIAISGALLTACAHQTVKPKAPALSAAAVAVNNAVIQKSPNDDRSYAAMILANNLQIAYIFIGL